MKKIILLLTLLGLSLSSTAQIDCNLVYYHPTGSQALRSYNPATNTTSAIGITLPGGGSGLAIANNLNGGSPSPTFYTVVNGMYQWWNGSSWVPTGHSSGGTAAVNPGGAGPYIYNLIGGSGQIWRYDGTGNAVLVVTLSGFGGPYDVIGDSQGNFYVFNNTSGNQQLRVYNPQGQLICTYNMVGLPTSGAGGGYAVVNGMVYANVGSSSYIGTVNGTTINFSPWTPNIAASDFASCEFPPFNTVVSGTNNSQIDMCAGGSIILTSTTSITSPVFNWSGPGIVSGQGTSSVVVNQPGTYTLTVTSGAGICSSTTTTTHLVTALSSGPALTPVGPLCVDGGPVQIQASMQGGTWSSNCANCLTTNGVFDPQVAGIGTHTVGYLVEGTCSDPVSMQIVVNALPNIDAGDDRTICEGSSTPLTATGGVSYVWSNGVANGAQVSPSNDTVYSVIGTDANGCSNTDQVNINVSTQLQPEFNAVEGICSGEQLAPLPTSSLNGVTGTWTPALNNQVTTTYTFTPAAGQCAANATLTINVQQSVVTNFEPLAPICSGEQVPALLNTSLNGVTGSWNLPINNQITTTYIFTPDQGQCASVYTTTLNVTPSVNSQFEAFEPVCFGTTIPALSTLSLNGISGQWSPALNNQITTTYTFTPNPGQCAAQYVGTLGILPLPTVNAGEDVRVCEGEYVLLNGSGAVDYQWSDGVLNNVPFVLEPGQYTYSVIGVDANGCSNSDVVNVIVDATPIVDISIQQEDVCSPSFVQFIVQSDQSLQNCKYDFGNGQLLLGCNDVQNRVFITPEVYGFVYTAQSLQGCDVSIIVDSAFLVASLPLAAFTVENPNLTTDDRVVRLDNLSENAVAYDWYFGMGLPGSTDFEPAYEFPAVEAIYEIRLVAISEYNCVDTAYAQVRMSDGLIYYIPNSFTPDGDEFNQTFKPIITAGIDVYSYVFEVYNRWGEIIFESHDLEIGWDGTYAGDVCQSGVYTWTIRAKRLTTDDKITLAGHVNLLR